MPAVPYPKPLNSAVATRMRRNRRRDTRPERALRSALHARGARFRVDHPIQLDGVRVRPDVSFTRWRVAVFVDGCFWHSCPRHGNTPDRNIAYWGPKLERNIARDRRVDTALTQAGWHVIRAWEHEPAPEVADRVLSAVCAAQSRSEASARQRPRRRLSSGAGRGMD